MTGTLKKVGANTVAKLLLPLATDQAIVRYHISRPANASFEHFYGEVIGVQRTKNSLILQQIAIRTLAGSSLAIEIKKDGRPYREDTLAGIENVLGNLISQWQSVRESDPSTAAGNPGPRLEWENPVPFVGVLSAGEEHRTIKPTGASFVPYHFLLAMAFGHLRAKTIYLGSGEQKTQAYDELEILSERFNRFAAANRMAQIRNAFDNM